MELQMLDLRAEGIAEARRLEEARAFSGAADGALLARFDGTGPLIARARQNVTRQRLAGRLLLIFRVSCEDATGRAIDAQVIALACAPAARPLAVAAREGVLAALRHAEPATRAHVDAVAARWQDLVAVAAAAFTGARMRRQRAIAGRAMSATTPPYQGGLFDRRAERAHRADALASEDRDREIRSRFRALERAAIRARPAELLLVLTP